MANGIYAAAAGLAAQQERIDALANDLANADTPGYRSRRIGFRDLVYGGDGGTAGAGAAAVDAGRSERQGPLAPSDDPLALAIVGPGYFQVRRADGRLALTRDGDFQLDASRTLVTSTGERVEPPVRVPAGTSPEDVTVAPDGTVTAHGKRLGRIELVDVPAPAGLVSLGSSQLAPSAASGAAAPAKGARIEQGQLEQSDVDVARALVDLLDAQQSYSLAGKVVTTQDELLAIANELRR
ncbi:MAG TPA: flagellar hook-basal body protein [Gaiellaceae bacterium]|nr:flagellar hook-basal body protein [Gaiellaceae bacterium]